MKGEGEICYARYSGLVIHSDGKYGFCANSLNEKLKFSSIREKTLEQIWNSPELIRFIFPDLDNQDSEYNFDYSKTCILKQFY